MTTRGRWFLVLALTFLILVVPFVYFRYQYTDGKRLRVVVPGEFYRCGQLSADGFTEAILRFQIRTIVNVQDDVADPDLLVNWFNTRTIKETELCRQLGVRYVHLPPDLVSRRLLPPARPAAIDHFLAILDDPANHPVLLHCRAGLHRTGILSAVYRMEYQGWSPADAMLEMKDHGFGEFFSTSANDYVREYVLTFRPGIRRTPPEGEAVPQGKPNGPAWRSVPKAGG